MEHHRQVVAVTGAASGIGRQVASAFAELHATVLALDLDQRSLHRVEFSPDEVINKAVERVTVDVTDELAVNQSVAEIQTSFDRLDVLVNAAGISTMQSVETLGRDEWDAVMAVNATGVFLMTRAVLPAMRARRSGCIVNIASAAGKRGSRFLSHYSASKFAVLGFTQSVALEVAAAGVRVNAVCPGLITTPMQEREIAWEVQLSGLSADEVMDRYLAAVPMGRLGTPQDVASTVVFLASDAASYITGEAINVGGGMVMD